MDNVQFIDITIDNVTKYGLCGYKSMKKPGLPEKAAWLKDRINKGLKIKAVISENDGPQGMLEYVPGEYCWRPVSAEGYMFIHCIFMGFKKEYKNKGCASKLLDFCEQDAKDQNKFGVAVVTRKGSFMVGKEIFLKRGYEVVDQTKPDFELLVKKLNLNAPNPKFKIPKTEDWPEEYKSGLTIIRADQCPYTLKNVNEMKETAIDEYGMTPNIINLTNYKEAQQTPNAFGVFCILFNGQIVAEHPISNTRFKNILNKQLKSV